MTDAITKLYEDWYCEKCRGPLGCRVNLDTRTLTVQRHGQSIVTMGPFDSGKITCEICGHDRQWMGCYRGAFLRLFLWLFQLAARK